ncbi:hypothetical protein [Hyphomicrobium sp.]|uniref:hypothetical protein n=1 Tax=Hyphomicrobium sp. TaxID=82 RepID=UPI0025C59FA1|nr:hypothetical protein [Hyphomicrobium sp.]MCC7254205.1 hypothetical protein [Hyphomicrobium sp.]
MKKSKPAPVPIQLDPSHPNYDAILLKRARLEAHRRRRLENSGALTAQEWKSATGKPAKTSARRGKD